MLPWHLGSQKQLVFHSRTSPSLVSQLGKAWQPL